MAKAVLLAWSSPSSPDRLAEFDEWYDGTHIPQVRAAVPSITSVTRYELVDPDSAAQSNRYLAVYELDDSDVQAASAAMAASAVAGRIEVSTAIDMAGNAPAVQWCRRHSG
jgi:hypothetical protein